MAIKWEDVSEITKGYVIKNLWKLKHWNYEYWDFYNECYILFSKCVEKYDKPIEEMKKLYFSSIDNWLIDMGRKSTNEAELFPVHLTMEEDLMEDNEHLGYNSDVEFITEISIAPKYIKNAVAIILSEPNHIRNRTLCKKLGLRKDTVDVLGILKWYFSGVA